MTTTAAPNWMSMAISFVIVGIVVALRMRTMRTMRRLRIERLWMLPALYAAIAAAMFATLPPHGIGWLLCAAALAIGGALGWQRGRLMHIEVDPVTHEVRYRQSPAALTFIVALIAVRSAMRAAIASGGATALHLNAATITDALIAMALGLLTMQRVEMYLRASRLIDEVRRS